MAFSAAENKIELLSLRIFKETVDSNFFWPTYIPLRTDVIDPVVPKGSVEPRIPAGKKPHQFTPTRTTTGRPPCKKRNLYQAQILIIMDKFYCFMSDCLEARRQSEHYQMWNSQSENNKIFQFWSTLEIKIRTSNFSPRNPLETNQDYF